MSRRTFFVGGNWKCNGTRESIKKLVEELNFAKIEKDCEVIVSPPYLYISQVRKTIKDQYQVAAQSSWLSKGGAFTGEISADMLKDVGVKWMIQGHSERRSIIGESDNMIAKKSQYCLTDIDGLLVGGATLKGPDFATICGACVAKRALAE